MPTREPVRMWGKPKDCPPIAWDEVEGRLRSAVAYWLVTAEATARPVWGVWHDERLLLSVGSTSLWRGLRASPRASVHLEDAHDVVTVEGSTTTVTDPAELAQFCEVYNPKYDWNFTPDTTGPIVVLTPATVVAWRTGRWNDAKNDPFPLAGSRFLFS
jgi:hypothetical protein